MTKRHYGIFVLLLFCFGFGITEVGKEYHFPEMFMFPEIPKADYAVTNEGVALGRYLFYDTILSSNYSMSCGSCHQQKFAFSDGASRFSRGANGVLQRRNTLPLFNLAWQASFFWDGRAKSIEEQVFHPITDSNELNLSVKVVLARLNASQFYRNQFERVFGSGPIDSAMVVVAIAQFERTLLSYRSKFDSAIKGKVALSEDELRGFVLMNDMTKGDCLHCHTTDSDPVGSTFEFSNNGLDIVNEPEKYPDGGRGAITGRTVDNGRFKIPSVRNLKFTAPYMHDGRFETLEEVLQFYSTGVKMSAGIDSKMGFAHKGGAHLTQKEQECIIAFLNAMSDSAFTTDSSFSNPFRRK